MIDFKDYITLPFIKNNQPLTNAPVCGMTVKSAGSMRFRWNENNQNRENVLRELSQIYPGKEFCPVQLDHTHIVYNVKKNPEEIKNKIGDGIITAERTIIPTVTVADCVPVYLYDSVTGVFGIVHSGWKGTGIAVDAISLACKEYGAKPEDFSVTIGPHIHECCYIVNEERAEYFAKNFTSECIKEVEAGVKVDWNNGDGKLFRLSLKKANIAALVNAGVKSENIFASEDCTCCSKNEFYGSNRRETKKSGRPDCFTVQAAFCVY